MDKDGFIDFITEAGKLKRLQRTGWIESGIPDPESVADHSFRVALIALILSDENKLDSLKAVRMALIHDLAEVEIGDLTPTQKEADPSASKRAEEEAMEKLLKKLPVSIRYSYLEAWREFVESSTEEAHLVRDADKLDMIVQASEYQKEGGDRSRLMRFWHAEIIRKDTRAIRDAVRIRERTL